MNNFPTSNKTLLQVLYMHDAISEHFCIIIKHPVLDENIVVDEQKWTQTSFATIFASTYVMSSKKSSLKDRFRVSKLSLVADQVHWNVSYRIWYKKQS